MRISDWSSDVGYADLQCGLCLGAEFADAEFGTDAVEVLLDPCRVGEGFGVDVGCAVEAVEFGDAACFEFAEFVVVGDEGEISECAEEFLCGHVGLHACRRWLFSCSLLRCAGSGRIRRTPRAKGRPTTTVGSKFN